MRTALTALFLTFPLLAASQTLRSWKIEDSSLILYDSSTYSFSVDTPSDSGLCSTMPSDEELLKECGGRIPSRRTIIHQAVPPLLEAFLADGLTLEFTAGQRTPDAEVTFILPARMDINPDEILVNVIGRGDVPLGSLSSQYAGRTGLNYPYSKVADVRVEDEGTDGKRLIFSNVDLRPYNGPDIVLTFGASKLPGKLEFGAFYSTSEPEKLSSPVVRALARSLPKGKYRVYDVVREGISPNGSDCSDKLNALIDKASRSGGGELVFPEGEYAVRTVHLKSDVSLNVTKGALIRALPGADAPERTWFSDRDYRSGLSPTDSKPYRDPQNYLTKQDVGHTFFHNAMFVGERIENVRIYGEGRISGMGNLVTSDKVMDNPPEKRADKMFSFKLCRNIEIGGTRKGGDLWYDEKADIPYYLDTPGRTDGMLHIDRGGHFVLLATGCDSVYVHDTYFAKHGSSSARDIYDFMGCRDVRVENIYSRLSSDDIVKLGSDCSLGYTRKCCNFTVRNIIGDTNCNLFQIGSETADDIENVYVDNIFVLGANKAGFSISTNDGGHVRNVWLNSGKTGSLHSRSQMRRTRTPFFISISNRGRTLGADVSLFEFDSPSGTRRELLVTNSSIGRIEDIHIAHIDIKEVYAGSSFRSDSWKPYDGSQKASTPIFAGYKLPDSAGISLPDSRSTGYIEGLYLEDINLTVKGGRDSTDRTACPPELGVGRYNVGDLQVQPSYGLWFRHVKDLSIKNINIKTETPDGRWPIYFDDVTWVGIE